jgi:chemotaxis signal transduction protein
MTAARESVTNRIDRLREDFDTSFAQPVRRHDGEQVELLAIRAGGSPYALRLSQTQGLHQDRPITSLPSPQPALLGLAGFAGTVVPVYDLAALLGHPVAGRPRWLVLTAGAPPLAFAFHDLDGHLRVEAEAIIAEAEAEADGDARRGFLRGIATLPDGSRPIVDLPTARAAVHHLAGHHETAVEVAR